MEYNPELVRDELEPNVPRAFISEVERVDTAKGSYSIYVAGGRSDRDIEKVISGLANQGVMLASPRAYGSILVMSEHSEQPLRIVVDGEELPVTVFLAGPRITLI